MRHLLPLSAVLLALSAAAQTPAPQLPEPQVNPDRTVTFRLAAPNASSASLALEGVKDPIPMHRDEAGIWTLTTEPLPPEYYGYHFQVDGRTVLDPRNPNLKPNLVSTETVVLVPGAAPEPWEPAAIPHGELHHHVFTSKIVQGLAANQSDFYVYTPPGYSPKSKEKYPVLYLLHGWSDNAGGWSQVGQANLILDSLIAAGKARPMIVVMPLGYGDMSFVHSFNVWNDPTQIDHNVQLFQQSLLTEILPQVESSYEVARGRENRAIAGLSMGGLESLTIGLTNTQQFAWVGGFSSAVHHMDSASFPSVTPKQANLRLLWIACGTSDGLIEPNRKLTAALTDKGFAVTRIETPGLHTWLVWRDNLLHFAPLLFQPRTDASTK